GVAGEELIRDAERFEHSHEARATLRVVRSGIDVSAVGHGPKGSRYPRPRMPDQTTTQDPTAPIDIDAYLARFDWHPEPELIGFRDPAAARGALAARGTGAWPRG